MDKKSNLQANPRLVGFTAEACLYKARQRYANVMIGKAALTTPQVMPQRVCDTDACGCSGVIDCIGMYFSGECEPGSFGCDSELGASAGCICDRVQLVG